MVRARATVEEDHRRMIFTEIPYGVNKSMLCESIANCVKEKKMDGITIVALVALAMAFLALIWGMIPSNDRVEINLDTTTVEVNE